MNKSSLLYRSKKERKKKPFVVLVIAPTHAINGNSIWVASIWSDGSHDYDF